MISDFRRKVRENYALLGYYAASSGKFLPTSRDNLSVRSSGVNISYNMQRVSGLMHEVLIDINVPFWYHPFINHLSCTALFCHILALIATCFGVLLTPSSRNLSPTTFPSQHMKYLLPLVRCLLKTLVFSQIQYILSEETQCSKGQLVDRRVV